MSNPDVNGATGAVKRKAQTVKQSFNFSLNSHVLNFFPDDDSVPYSYFQPIGIITRLYFIKKSVTGLIFSLLNRYCRDRN